MDYASLAMKANHDSYMPTEKLSHGRLKLDTAKAEYYKRIVVNKLVSIIDDNPL